jgi:hypothetical protein
MIKVKKQAASIPTLQQKSEALNNFETNLDQIMAFIRRIQSDKLHKSSQRTVAAINSVTASLPNANKKAIIRKLQRIGKQYGIVTNEYLAFLLPACRWMAVMLVSFLETFFEDGLVEIAKRNPKVVKDVEVPTSRILEAEAIEELRTEIRLQWAHDALRPGGPQAWYKKLRNMGANPLADETIIAVTQHLWETRNLIVHSRCVASAAYARAYAKFGAEAGAEVKVNLATFGMWLKHIGPLVQWADALFQNYGRDNKGQSPEPIG